MIGIGSMSIMQSATKKDIDALADGGHLHDLAIYLANYAREHAEDTERVFLYALEKVRKNG